MLCAEGGEGIINDYRLKADSFAGRSAGSRLPRLAGLRAALPRSRRLAAALESALALCPQARQRKVD